MSSADGALSAWPLALAACAISLDDEPERPPEPDDVPVLESCAIAGVTGRLQSVPLDDGVLVVADALVDGTTNAMYAVPALPAPGACTELAPPPGVMDGLDTTALAPDATASVRAVFALGDERLAFVTTGRGFEALGTGLARRDPDTGVFVAGPDYLFTADRPSYGDAVLVEGEDVYAYGCAETGFLTDSCFVARAPTARVDDPTAWTYYQDGNTFGADPDDAWPILDGGRGLAVARFGDRIVAVHPTPLGDTLYQRSGLGPTGPWSAAVALGRCALPAEAFCGALALHPVPDDPTAAILTYGIASFASISAAGRSTRLVATAVR